MPWQGSRAKRSNKSGWEQSRRRKSLLRRSDLTCYICGQVTLESDLEADHVRPLAEGGRDSTSNMKLACRACHREKSLEEARRGRDRAA